MISLQSLMKVKGYYQCRYGDILNLLRKVSADPVTDVEQFFRQMVFNALVNNTDDHLKNFWMVCDIVQGWRLSPAFDLVPNIGRNDEHVLFFDLDPIFPGRAKLEQLGRAWGVSRASAIILIHRRAGPAPDGGGNFSASPRLPPFGGAARAAAPPSPVPNRPGPSSPPGEMPAASERTPTRE